MGGGEDSACSGISKHTPLKKCVAGWSCTLVWVGGVAISELSNEDSWNLL